MPNVPYTPDLHHESLHDVKLTVTPSPLDVRDFIMSVAGDDKPPLPPAHTIKATADVLDQSRLGSCTANGMAGMYATELIRAGKPPVIISRLALYYAERVIEGDTGSDNGAVPRDGLLTMLNQGVGREDLWPYDIAKFTEPPSPDAIADAPNHKISAFYRVPGLDAVKRVLVDDKPVGLAMLVYSGMLQSKNGVIPMPDPSSQPEGGHFVYLRGYADDATWPGGGYLIIRNSWGAQAGDGTGDYFLAYAYAGNTQLVSEYWHIDL
ncbi:MAG: C1 family peptidase [Thermomicrobia bacterium]|nr:C1 family peptidase [Thermomicrobia bacterium]MCA1725135.1 C1 family peptidase [Thermomicrobia bacterium]